MKYLLKETGEDKWQLANHLLNRRRKHLPITMITSSTTFMYFQVIRGLSSVHHPGGRPPLAKLQDGPQRCHLSPRLVRHLVEAITIQNVSRDSHFFLLIIMWFVFPHLWKTFYWIKRSGINLLLKPFKLLNNFRSLWQPRVSGNMKKKKT